MGLVLILDRVRVRVRATTVLRAARSVPTTAPAPTEGP